MKTENTTKEKILESARYLMGKSGYSGVSINDIAKNVGITKASIYYFFKNKESIYLEILKEIIKEIQINYTINSDTKVTKELLIEKIENSIKHGVKHGTIIRIPDMQDFKNNKNDLIEIDKETKKVHKLMINFLKKCHVSNPEFAVQMIIDMSHAYILRNLCKTNELTPRKLALNIVKVLKN
jgi:AcrR family transcriptional regulator